MYFLAIESSCDETAAAVFTDESVILSSVVASQTDLHPRFGGVVPEIAARAHLQRLLPVIDEALKTAKVGLDQIGELEVSLFKFSGQETRLWIEAKNIR